MITMYTRWSKLLVFLIIYYTKWTNCQDYWEYHSGDQGGTRYSELEGINKDNVNQLQKVWEYRYGNGPRPLSSYTGQTTPIMIDAGGNPGRDLLIFCTPWVKIVALEPSTGEEVWVNEDGVRDGSGTCRGVAVWTDPLKGQGDLCFRMVYAPTKDRQLMAVDADLGVLCPGFGEGGFLNMSVPGERCGTIDSYCYFFRNPPVIVNGVLTIGAGTSDNSIPDTPKGQMPGYDPRTGQELWRFFVLPTNPDDPAMATWYNGTDGVGSGNIWVFPGGDDELGLIYLPTSSATGEHHGTHRPGDNLYTDSVVALNATTGELVWYNQLVHHDIWDYDLNAQPVVCDVTKDGITRKAVLQYSKMGFLFVLDAATGEPIYEIEERPVPTSDVPGEYTSPTQPYPKDEFLQLAPLTLDMNPGADLWNNTPETYDFCNNVMMNGVNRIGKLYDPATTYDGTFWVPGNHGGANIAGPAYHKDLQIAVLSVNRHPAIVQLIPNGLPPEDRPSWCYSVPGSQGFEYQECTAWNIMDQNSIPCHKPPWARLVALNMTGGYTLWNIPLGFLPGYDPSYGSRWTVGHLLITKPGLVFAANGEDYNMRVLDIETGEVLWMTPEPLPAHAAGGIMTYRTRGKQYVALQAAGHNMASLPREMQVRSDHIIAYSLP